MSKQKKTITVPFENLVIDTNFNTRKTYNNIDELADSIMQQGLLQNPGVTPSSSDPNKYFVVYGFRRYKALEKIRAKLGPDAFATVDCILKEGTVEELRDANLRENIDRENLEPHEIALAVKRMANAGLEQRDIATRLGRPQSWVSYHFKVATKLGTPAWKAFENGDITLDQALNIADVPEAEQKAVVTKVLDADTRAEAKSIVKAATDKSGTKRQYANKGRPALKTLGQLVSDVSEKGWETDTDTDSQFFNGVAAGIRIALGETKFEALDKEDEYLDREFHKRGQKPKGKPGRPVGSKTKAKTK